MPLSTVLGAQSLVQPAVCTTATRPASPYTGQAIYDTTTASQLIWNGTAWTTIGPSPFTFISKATFSSVASVSMPAGTFTSTYKNYRVILEVTGTSASQLVGVRVNTAGTPVTSAVYLGGFVITNTAGTVTGLGTNTTSGRAIYLHSTVGGNMDILVYNPNNSGTGTNWTATTRGADSGDALAGGAGGIYVNALQDNDGLTFVVGGTFSGYYSVYGIKDS